MRPDNDKFDAGGVGRMFQLAFDAGTETIETKDDGHACAVLWTGSMVRY